MPIISRFLAAFKPSDSFTPSRESQEVKQRPLAATFPIVCLCTAVITSLPLMVNSSPLARASFGISGFPQTASCLAVFFILAPLGSRKSSAALRWLLSSALLLVIVALIALETTFGMLRQSETYIAAAHDNTTFEYLVEQGLFTIGWFLIIANAVAARQDESFPDSSVPRWVPRVVMLLFLVQDLCLRVLGLHTTQPLFFTDSLMASEALLFVLHLGRALLVVRAVRNIDSQLLKGFIFTSLAASLLTLAGTTIGGIGIPANSSLVHVADLIATAGFSMTSAAVAIISAINKRPDKSPSHATHPRPIASCAYKVSNDHLGILSPRERKVIELTLSGASQKEIASMLDISVPSVGTYRIRSYRKLGVTDKNSLINALQTPGTHNGIKNGNEAPCRESGPDSQSPSSSARCDLRRNIGKLAALQTAGMIPLAIVTTRASWTSPLGLALLAMSCLAPGIILVITHMSCRDVNLNLDAAKSAPSKTHLLPMIYGTFFLGVAVALRGNSLSHAALISGYITLLLVESLLLLTHHYVELATAFDTFCAELYRPPFGEQRVCHTLASKGFDADAIEVLNKTLQGKTCSCIAREQLMSTSSVRALRSAAYRAFGAHSKAEFAQNVKQHMEWG